MKNAGVFASLLAALAACTFAPGAPPPGAGVVIYSASRIITMVRPGDVADAVAVREGRIVDVGSLASLRGEYAAATVDTSFADKVIVPGLIDPHIHVMLGGLLYAQPFAPPWPMASAGGMTQGYPTAEAFRARLREIVSAAPSDGSPVVAYGYHNLVQGPLDRGVLDAIAPDRPLVVWHYSGHDFYLNSAALAAIGATPELRERFHGVDLTPQGELTGRIYEDAGFLVLLRLGDVLFSPEVIARGTSRYFEILRRAGVTATADLAYGAFGLAAEDRAIAATWSQQRAGFRLYLVPEFRAFEREFGSPAAAATAVREMVAGRRMAAATVLPRVKFFADGAFYSQTMRLSAPGYLAGQSQGSEGLWVVEPERIAPALRPYLESGLAGHIHSNGDAAQDATLAALAALRGEGLQNDFVIEHVGLLSPAQTERAAKLGAMTSIASHYAYFMAHTYEAPLGRARASWITPAGALSRAGVPVALHSDAPLAPPQPLRAAGAHITRATRDGAPVHPEQALSPYDALEAVTLDAARVLGLEEELGSIAPGKRADFTVLERSPLATPGEDWASIGVWGVVLEGEKRPLTK
jgi:predicted amidohydrolase YtcJ